ncbi:MAG TPA: hypothetical protein VGL23_12285 [Chloroflexota bacterium]|jgi:translation initiation factor IF-2
MALKRALGRSSIRRGVRILALSLWLVGAACTDAGRPAAPAAPPAAPGAARAILVSSAGATPAAPAHPAEPARGAAPAAGQAPGGAPGGPTMAQQRLFAPAATPIPGTLKAAERAALAATAVAGTPGPPSVEPGGPTPTPTLRPAAPPRRPRIAGMATGPVVRDRPVDARGVMRADSLAPATYRPLRAPPESLAGEGAVEGTP